jgi:hypothetical protein
MIAKILGGSLFCLVIRSLTRQRLGGSTVHRIGAETALLTYVSCSAAVDEDRIYAVALLTRQEVTQLGPTFNRAWPVEDTQCFNSLLHAIDEADQAIRRERNGS